MFQKKIEDIFYSCESVRKSSIFNTCIDSFNYVSGHTCLFKNLIGRVFTSLAVKMVSYRTLLVQFLLSISQLDVISSPPYWFLIQEPSIIEFILSKVSALTDS